MVELETASDVWRCLEKRYPANSQACEFQIMQLTKNVTLSRNISLKFKFIRDGLAALLKTGMKYFDYYKD